MSKDKTNQKGITLIALVITIIVMLILVGVSVTVALNGGLFSTAKEAAEGTATKRNEELQLSEGKVEINGEWYNSIDEYVNGGSSNEPIEPENPTGYTAYTIGQEVTVGGENFYVIEDSDETNPNVTLLAKYSLNTAGTAQLNASYKETACPFASTNYWSSETEYPLNLNEYPIPEGVTSVISTAKTYGQAKGGTGRLITYEEVSKLKTDYEEIIVGEDSTGSGLVYWLGTATGNYSVYYMMGGGSGPFSDLGYIGDGDGYVVSVRPVVEISKSSIS